MISLISGKLESKKDKYVVVDAAGVGYRVFVSPETLSKVPKIGGTVKLHTLLYVRESAMELYGFLAEEELVLCEMLTAISGIGPKAAMSILAIASPQKIKEAIAEGDDTILTRVSGIGRKTAQKVILELKERVREELRYIGKIENVLDSEVRDALQALGYGERQIRETLKQVPDSVKKVEERVRAALKVLGKR